jgi:hypothetical protein
MRSFAQRRYVFRRRPVGAKVAFACAALCAVVLALNLTNALAAPGGYLRQLVFEEPADRSSAR